MKKILLLGGSSQQVVAIKKAKELGYYTILCDFLADNPGQYAADKFYQVSTTDKEAVLDVARKEEINGILAYASDPAAPTAAYVAEKLGLPSNPLNSVEILCNKDKFRDFLLAHGFNTPKSIAFNEEIDAYEGIKRIDYPVMIKPVDSSGSKGASLINGETSETELKRAIKLAFSFSRSHRIIIEEYIEKKHPYLIGGDIFIYDGQVVQWGLMNCHRDRNVNPLVPVGKSFPVHLDESDLILIKDTLGRLVTELGIRIGSMNVELIIDKNNRVFPIDVGPRAGGNMIPDLLGMVFKCDVVEMNVRVAMGERIELSENTVTPFYATLNLHSDKDGLFDGIEISPTIEQFVVRKEIYKKHGDNIYFFSNASDCIGILFFKFPDMETMINAENNMNRYVKIKTYRVG